MNPKHVLFLALTSTARRISEIYGTEEGSQAEGEDIIRSACEKLNISTDAFYEMQDRVLSYRRKVNDLVSAYVDSEFHRVLGCSAPRMADLLEDDDDTEEADDDDQPKCGAW